MLFNILFAYIGIFIHLYPLQDTTTSMRTSRRNLQLSKQESEIKNRFVMKIYPKYFQISTQRVIFV